MLDEEGHEDDDDDDAGAVIGGSAGSSSRQRGSPTDRLRAVLNQPLQQSYARFGIKLPDEQSPEQRDKCAGIHNELRSFIMSRPKKTNDNYWRLQEQLLPVLQQLYEAGIVKEPPVPADRQVQATAAFLVTPDAMVPILKHLMYDKDIKSIVQQHQAGAAAATDPFNPFNQDEYPVGSSVDILADLEDFDEAGPQHQPLLVIARATVKGLSSLTAAGAKAYEVDGINVLKADTFADQEAWVDGTMSGEGTELSLQEQLDTMQLLLVPVTHLRATGAGRDGPQVAGAAVGLTKEAVIKMKLKELKLVCSDLGLGVTGNRKAPYQEALLGWVDEQGCDVAMVQAPQAALKLSRYTYKNWMNAATDLQRTQHMLLAQPLVCVLTSFPRVQRWVQMFKRTTTMALRRAVNDRQAGTLPSRPGEPQYLAMSVNWLLTETYESMLYRAMFLEQMANAMRGSEVRGLELADRFIKVYDTVKPVAAVAVGSLKMNGKTNQNGQLMYYCHLRHADPRVCPVAADGLFQLLRFAVQGQPFPDFTGDPEDWFFLSVYPSATGGRMDYEEHRKNHRDALNGIDCVTKKSTHLPRQACADRVIAAGGSREQAMVHGHWARQDPDLSYMNSPSINTMLLVAGYSSLLKHYLSWTVMAPPKYCMDKMFVTADGVTIDEQVDKLIELNRERETRNVTRLHVAQYFKEIGTAALQALPILQSHGLIPDTHPLLQHPAINNEHYREYAVPQSQHSLRLMEQFRLLETPVLGPVFTQVTPLGHISSALGTVQERHKLMTGAVVTYAATTAAAHTQARGVNLSGSAHFMVVSTEERDLLLTCRCTGSPQQTIAAAAATAAACGSTPGRSSAHATGGPAAGAAADAAAPSTRAAADAAAASTGAAADAAAASTGAAAGAAAASTGAAAGAAAPSTRAAAGAAAGAAAASTGAAAGAAADAAAPSTRAAAGAAAGAAAASTGAAAASTGAAAGAAAASTGAAAGAAAASTGAAAGAAAASTGAAAGAAAAGTGAASGCVVPGIGRLHVEGDDNTKLDLLVGLCLHNSEMLRFICSSGVAPAGVHGAHSSSFTGQDPQPPQQQSQHRQHSGQRPATPPPAVHDPSFSTGAKVFTVSTTDIQTAHMLLQLFESGWPLGSPLKIYTGLAEPGAGRGLKRGQQQQLDLLRQGFLLMKSLSQQHGISMQQAACVVEVWRSNTAAIIQADGTVAAVSADTPPASGTVVESLLPAKDKRWTMNNLLQQARKLQCVQDQKDGTKSSAGKAGGRAPKKPRTK